METLNYKLHKLIYLLQESDNSKELRKLINTITSKIQSYNSNISSLEEDMNDFDF
jgi:hypothetical protein